MDSSRKGPGSKESSSDTKPKPIGLPEVGEPAREKVRAHKEASAQIFGISHRVAEWVLEVPDMNEGSVVAMKKESEEKES